MYTQHIKEVSWHTIDILQRGTVEVPHSTPSMRPCSKQQIVKTNPRGLVSKHEHSQN